MRKFRIFYHDNSGPKCEEFEGDTVFFEERWLKIYNYRKLVIAIPTEMVYSVEEITGE